MLKIKNTKVANSYFRWKGYCAEHDSWEAEEHLSCPDLIQKLMDHVKDGKRLTQKHLRPVPKQADRLSIVESAIDL